MYKNVDDYYTNEGQPIKCYVCENTDLVIISLTKSVMNRAVLCRTCATICGVVCVNSALSDLTGKLVYNRRHRRAFCEKYPQNELLNAVQEVLTNV